MSNDDIKPEKGMRKLWATALELGPLVGLPPPPPEPLSHAASESRARLAAARPKDRTK